MKELDELLDTAPCGYLSFGDDGAVVQVNRTLLEVLGYTRQEIVGAHVERILTVGSRIFYQTHWFPLLRLAGGADEIFLMLQDSAGAPIGMLVNTVRRERGSCVTYDSVLMRVRERQKYEDELLRARRTAERALADLEAQTGELGRANELLEAQAVELELQQQQLHERAAELELTGEELRVANEELLERSEEAERLRDAAEQASRAKSTFLAVMSHELRTPLNAIAGYVQIMELGIHGPLTDAQREDLARITSSQAHLLRLINDVLNLAQVEAGRVEYAIEDVAVVEMLGAVLPMIEPQLQKKQLVLSTEVSPCYVARADREKVQQILLNLLGNAVKFTPAGGRIRVEAAASDPPGKLLLNVQDTGIGIPGENLESIFEPFVQVDSSRKRGAEGSGLGLAISRDLARGMGGDLTAVSAPGEGSTFTLSLPRGALG